MKTSLRKQQERERRRQEAEQQREETERALMLREERWMRLVLKSKARNETMTAVRERKVIGLDADSRPDSDYEDADEEVRATQELQVLPKRTSKKVSALKAIYKRRKPGRTNGRSTRTIISNNSDNDNNHSLSVSAKLEWSSPFISSSAGFLTVEMVEDDAEFDYGGEFDDVVDETQLTRLLC
ncbi:hypothetical protein PINS_up001921 [Pythium insidiosum]|nr:hypothetical protein PINS_up001921 [Pythium insidiosum]